MKLDFIKTFGQKIVFYIIACAAVTTAVTGGVFYILSKAERYLIDVGYRSVALGPDGVRPTTRITILIVIAILTFSVTFYLLIRSTVRYINEIVKKVQDISAGDFDHPITVKGNDEFAVIAENLNIMQKNIKEIMERERIAEHTKNDLISSVAHDLRTPLTSIIGYLGWVRTRKDLDNATRDKYIEIAYDKANRLEQLTNELFGFVKLEHKEMKLHTGNLDLVQLMEQMLDEMTPSFVKNELDVRFRHDANKMIIEADGELLARLFGNLLNNAVKYGKEGKQILIYMKQTGNYVVTRVTNYGRVIPKSELEHIFMKFYRTEQSRSRDTGGTGLGLAIVQQIVELHHGKVMVKSDLQGTVFEVELPTEQPKEEIIDE
ncbi:MAG: HAMP domain-containing histidine kinase [Fusicatenibacter sp.]|nr:HAMP domain-containing histidine kinase [Fusicatenibacter sp.]